MRKVSAALVIASIVGFAGPAHAQEQQGNGLLPQGWGNLSATLGAVSDYRFRGISQTDENPAVQGSIDWAHDSGFYLGLWGSNVDFFDANVEIDAYGGYTFASHGFDFDLGALYYWYPDADESLDYDYAEAKAAVRRDFGFASGNASISFSPDNFASSGPATYVSAGVDVPVMDTGFTVTGAAGHQWIDDEVAFGAPDYTDWSLGASYTLYGFDLGLQYVDTNISDRRCNDLCDATAIFSVSRSFN